MRLRVASFLGTLLAGCATAVAGHAAAPEWTDEAAREASRIEAELEATPPPPPGEVQVHLAFGRAVDLDLYVTGPLEETVYYANTPSAIGGELVADRHCEEKVGEASSEGSLGIETVRFPAAPAGRYRVGLDYPHACEGRARPVPFVVLVDGPAGRQMKRGLASFEFFELAFLEFDVPSQENTHEP